MQQQLQQIQIQLEALNKQVGFLTQIVLRLAQQQADNNNVTDKLLNALIEIDEEDTGLPIAPNWL